MILLTKMKIYTIVNMSYVLFTLIRKLTYLTLVFSLTEWYKYAVESENIV